MSPPAPCPSGWGSRKAPPCPVPSSNITTRRTVSAATWAAWSKPIAKSQSAWESCPNRCKARTKAPSSFSKFGSEQFLESPRLHHPQKRRSGPARQGHRPCPERAWLWLGRRSAPGQGDRPGTVGQRCRTCEKRAQGDVRKAARQHRDREVRDRVE